MQTEAAVRGKTYDMVYIGIFTVLIAVCSWISIPAAVPFTLQTFGVFMAVEVLGGKRGTMAVLVYILMGAVGLPVFAGFQGGIGIIFNTTGGYIVGFLCPDHVGGRVFIWEKTCSPYSFYDCRAARLLCAWNRMVYGDLRKNNRSSGTYDSPGLVRHSVYHTGSCKNRACVCDLR